MNCPRSSTCTKYTGQWTRTNLFSALRDLVLFLICFCWGDASLNISAPAGLCSVGPLFLKPEKMNKKWRQWRGSIEIWFNVETWFTCSGILDPNFPQRLSFMRQSFIFTLGVLPCLLFLHFIAFSQLPVIHASPLWQTHLLMLTLLKIPVPDVITKLALLLICVLSEEWEYSALQRL